MPGKPQSALPPWSSEDATREVLLGFIRIHVLHHAAQHPVYGLWLIQELGEHGYNLSAGTLYPILHGLESRGLLRCSPKLFEGKIRKYYAITPKGRRALAQMRRRLAELTAEVLPQPPSPRAGRRRLRS